MNRKVRIKGYKIMYITMNTFPGLKNIRIDKAAYYLTFIYNVVLLDHLKDKGY